MTFNESTFEVIDRGQLRRIEATHRGFLYQHLFATGCLLLAASSGVAHVAVEWDEDVEVWFTDGAPLYCQIKTRQHPLDHGELAEVLGHFDRIRSARAADSNQHSGSFWLILNIAPNGKCLAQFEKSVWRPDVQVSWPGGGTAPRPRCLPPPWHDLSEAVRWCAEKADTLPSAKLAGETLAWKLSALVQYAGTGPAGQRTHQFHVADLPSLFEQVVVQLHRFPQSPTPYRELRSEPIFESENRIRLIVGLSGSGKTAWACEASHHSAEEFIYFDLAEVPDGAVAAAVTREVAARCVRTADVLATVLAPGLVGMDSLRMLDAALETDGLRVTVVLDNVHRLVADTATALVRATRSLRWVLLAQPTGVASGLGPLLDITPEHLGGFTLDSIAAEFRRIGVLLDAVLAERIALLTGGLPLFVRQAAAIAAREYGGDAAAMCAALELRTHVVSTPQEDLLARALSTLSVMGRHAAAVVAISEVPLAREEGIALLAEALGVDNAAAASALRELHGSGVTQHIGGASGLIAMHDSFRVAASGVQHAMAENVVERALRQLKELMVNSLAKEWDFARQTFLLRLLPRTGDTKTLIDIATGSDEQFAEYGYVPLVRPLLEAAANDERLSGSDRFWALDAIVFWDFQDRNDVGIRKYLPELERLHDVFGRRDQKQSGSLLVKKLLWAGKTRDADAARAVFFRAQAEFSDDPSVMRVMRYNFIAALFQAGDYSASAADAAALVREYYQVLGLRPQDVLFANPDEIDAKLRKGTGEPSAVETEELRSELKRLGDTLELEAMSLNRLGKQNPFARMHAHKFYVMAMAASSAVRVGQDVADEFVGREDFEGALKFLDSAVLPIVEKFRLLGHLIPVRAQRAVVLAYLGRGDEATAEMVRLRSFATKDPECAAELARQEAAIEELVRSPRLARQYGGPAPEPIRPDEQTVGRRKVGRNAACPCGSGKKFKRCCGK